LQFSADKPIPNSGQGLILRREVASRVWRIGWPSHGPGPSVLTQSFLQGMRELALMTDDIKTLEIS
jgi:hypothetical protein